MKRWLIWLHRYLGIPMSVVFVIWFLSGIVMMYTGDMPRLEERERLLRLGAIELDAITLSLADATAQAGLSGEVSAARLQTLLGRPAYRLSRSGGRDVTIFADTGEAFDIADVAQGHAEVARFSGVAIDAVRHAQTLTQPDQWTITEAASLPLEQFDIDDGRGTRAYFSRRSGEVELLTDRGSRALAWAGAIPHWFYFTPLRTNQPLWYWVVVWLSAIGCFMAVLGLVLAFTQFRRSSPFRLKKSVRYHGWMRWHYFSGALFGIFVLTWVFSGLLSMEPFAWTNATGLRLPPDTFGAATLEAGRYEIEPQQLTAALNGAAPLEIEFSRVLEVPSLVVATSTPERRRLLDAVSLTPRDEPLPAQAMLDVLAGADVPVPISEHAVLDRYDAYYYARDLAAPLPVLRVKFNDPADTWYYFDLMTGEPVYANHRLGRIERWLFNGLHSLDFGFWYDRRPLWDVGMILLLVGALGTSAIGLCLGWKRLFRSVFVNRGA